MQNKSLGKGLSALLKEDIVSVAKDELVKMVDLESIEAGEYQPRKVFEYEKIKELADSISINGLLQPIIVNQNKEGKYKIIAGERRWRACKIAGLTEVPVILKDLPEQEILEIALVENIQRENLSAVEEAEGFDRLIKDFNYTQEQIARILGKSRSHVANLLRLNQLPQTIKDKVNDGILSMGHARCLIGHEQAEIIMNYIIENDLNVRQTESIVKNWSQKDYTNSPQKERFRKISSDNGTYDNELGNLAKTLSAKFGVKVTIENYSIGGRIILNYENFDELDKILSHIN